jgi:hypothetical protein
MKMHGPGNIKLVRILFKFTRRDKPIRIIGDSDNQLLDKWSFTVLLKCELG